MKINYSLKKILILFFLTITFSFSQQKEINSIKKDTTELSQGKAYKMLYDNQVKANDAVLKTIFYALGGLGTALILVFASNWWFNDKKVRDIINEIDKKVKDLNKDTIVELTEKVNQFSIEKTSEIHQTQSKLQEEITQNITSLTLKFTDFTDKIRAELKDDEKDLLSNFQKQIETFNENFRQQLNTINETITTINNNLIEIVNGKDKALKVLIEKEKETNQRSFNSLKASIYRNEYYMWEAKGVSRNAFMALVNELEVKIENKYSNLSFYLGQMSEAAEKLTYLSDSDKKHTASLLEKVTDNDKELAEKITAKIEVLKPA